MLIKPFVQSQRDKIKIVPSKFRYLKDIFNNISEEEFLDLKDLANNGDYKNLEKTPDYLAKLIINCENLSLDDIYYFFEELKKLKVVNYINSTDKAVKDLLTLKRKYGDGKFSCEGNSFSINEEIQIYYPDEDIKYNFGYFRIDFFIDKCNVVTAGSNKKNNTGLYHPYVNNSQLCLGDYLEPYKKAMSSLRYYDAYTLVMEVLTEYKGDNVAGNAAGPYNNLFTWTGVRCCICDALHNYEVSIPCSKTKQNICPECSKNPEYKDEYTGKFYHPHYLGVCDICNKNTTGLRKQKDSDKMSCIICRRG